MGRALIILVSLLLCLVGLEKVYDFGLRHNHNQKVAHVLTSPKNATLLIHGPCEPLWMLSPALLDPMTGISSYNLSLSHSDFADNYLHLYQYLKTNKAPRYLLLYVTPESLDARFNTFNAYRFAPYLDDSLIARTVKENDPNYYKWCWMPFMKYAYYSSRVNFEVIQGYKHFLTGRTTAYYEDGFEPPATRVWGNHQGIFVKLYKGNTTFKPIPLREKYLRLTIKLAQQHGTEVFLYESPVLTESLDYQLNRKQILARIDTIASEENVPYIRFEGLPIANERRYFISTLNFNMEGIQLFNDTLGKYIRCHIVADTLD